MRSSTTFFFTCLILVGAVHCGGTNDSVPAATSLPSAPAAGTDDAGTSAAPATDGGSVVPATPDAAPPSGTCEAMANAEAPITAIDMVASAAPPPTGGAIQDGTYRLSALTLYVGASGTAGAIPITLKGIARVQGSVVDNALEGTDGEGQPISERTRETFTTTGPSVTYTMTCPAVKTRTGTYSASSTSMTLYLVNDTGQTVGYTYTR